MYLKQLTVFLENREGRLDSVTDILSKNNILPPLAEQRRIVDKIEEYFKILNGMEQLLK